MHAVINDENKQELWEEMKHLKFKCYECLKDDNIKMVVWTQETC